MQEPEDLEQRTKKFALRMIKMCAVLPKSQAGRILGRQVLRSGTSVGANYREARRARSKVEFIAKIGDCLKEICETQYWVELIQESGMLPSRRLKPLSDETTELVAIFMTIDKNARKSLQAKKHQ